jgi:nicotinamidase/pyrazinamidase
MVKPGDALLIIDVQNDFCSGGALAVPHGEDVVAPINRLTRLFDAVVATQDWHSPRHNSFASHHHGKSPFQTTELDYGTQVLWPDHCVQGTHGAEFHPDLDLTRCQMIVRKGFRPGVDSYSAFRENDKRTTTGLAGFLKERGIKRIFLTGLATDFCVFYSAMDARAEGFAVVLVEDACRAIDLDGSLALARSEMAKAGVVTAQSNDLA